MLGEEEDKDRLSGIARKRYLRSVSWTDRSPTKPSTSSNPRPQPNRTARSFLPPLSISRRNADEWPAAGSDDLGVWPDPQTPRGSVNAAEKSSSDQLKRDKLAFFDKECSRIADHIYLGSDVVAKNRDVLRQNGITHVLNCVGFVCPEYFKVDFLYKTLWLRDSPSEDITSILYDVFDYFEDVREQGGRVFVHCCRGVSRSTSLVIAYLMWREGQSFEDAFQYVKAARGVTNPNMGFACQLLQCQKRVHAVPASPNSVLRMYVMAPHSAYDPLHLVPKTVNNPGVGALDSRGAFIVHVPSGLYVWNGRNCSSVMSSNARAAAFQVITYERAKGPVVNTEEGEEPPEFWEALANGQPLASGIPAGVGEKKVDEYNLDFELFHKALAGGVVPPFPVSSAGSETCLPARENGWSRLRRKFSDGLMREFIASSKSNSSEASAMAVDAREEEEKSLSFSDPSSPSSPPFHVCGSPDSFECFPEKVVNLDPISHPLSPVSCGSPDSFSCFLDRSPKFGSKSPTISPSTSDYASSFSFSPSSSNWSDLSYLSSQQPSPSGLDPTDPFPAKNVSLLDDTSLLDKEATSGSPEEFHANHDFRMRIAGLPCQGIARSIAERRGSNPPPRMLLPSTEESHQSKHEDHRKEVMLDEDIFSRGNELWSGTKGEKGGEIRCFSGETIDGVTSTTKPALYKLPCLNKVEGSCIHKLDSRSSYVLIARESSLDRNIPSRLTFWLGRETLLEKGKNRGNTSENSDVLCEMVAQGLLNRMDFPLDTTVQVVREGEEPEQFLSQLRCLALQETEDARHS